MLRVIGIVQSIEHNAGTIPAQNGNAAVEWATVHVEVDGERIKYRVRQDGTMPVALPNEGDEVEVSVSVGLREQRGNLLHPYLLALTALGCRVLRNEVEVEADRAARSASSVPSQAGAARVTSAPATADRRPASTPTPA